VQLLDLAQLAHLLVVLGVGDLGIVELVVARVVVLDGGAQLGGAGRRVRGTGHAATLRVLAGDRRRSARTVV